MSKFSLKIRAYPIAWAQAVARFTIALRHFSFMQLSSCPSVQGCLVSRRVLKVFGLIEKLGNEFTKYTKHLGKNKERNAPPRFPFALTSNIPIFSFREQVIFPLRFLRCLGSKQPVEKSRRCYRSDIFQSHLHWTSKCSHSPCLHWPVLAVPPSEQVILSNWWLGSHKLGVMHYTNWIINHHNYKMVWTMPSCSESIKF